MCRIDVLILVFVVAVSGTNMSTKWFDIGKELGMSGDDLMSFVQTREKLERDERQANREERQANREDREAEERILEKKIELARIQNQSRNSEGNDSIDSGNGRRLAPAPKLPHFVEGKDNMDAYLHRFEKYAESQSCDLESVSKLVNKICYIANVYIPHWHNYEIIKSILQKYFLY